MIAPRLSVAFAFFLILSLPLALSAQEVRTRSIAVRAWSPDKLPVAGATVLIAQEKGDSVRAVLSENGSARLRLTHTGTHRVLWLQDQVERDLGTFRLEPGFTGPAELEIVISAMQGRNVGYIALRPLGSKATADVRSQQTGPALAKAPERLSRDATVAELQKQLLEKRTSGTVAAPLSKPEPAPAPIRLATDMSYGDAAQFDTGALPTESRDPEIRRVWRLIGNAATDAEYHLAQAALADALLMIGDTVRSEAAKKRAAFWKRGSSE